MTFYSCPFLQDHACRSPNHPSVVVEESRMTVGYHKGMDAEGIPGEKRYLLNWIQNEHKKYLLNWIQIAVV